MEIAKLFVSLALEAGDYVKGMTNIPGQTKAIAAQVEKSIGGMKGQLKTVGQNAVDFGKKFQSVLSNVATALLPVGVAMGAVGLAAKLMWDSLNRGAELELTRSRFENLTESIGTTADTMLGKMREATQGMISDAELMASGSDIISLGLAKTEDQAVRLASVVGQLGWDMQQVILTFANNSTMRLDALGLSVEAVTTRAKELEAAGMSMDAAFDLAVIEEGEKKLELLGSAADTTAGKIKQLEAMWSNARDSFDEAFAVGVADEFERITGAANGIGPAMTAASAGAGELLAQLVGIFGGILTNQTFIDLLKMGREAQAEQAEEKAAADAIKATDEALAAWALTVENANDAAARARRGFQGLAVDTDAFGTNIRDVKEAVRDFSDGLDDGTTPALTAAEQKFLDATNAMVLARYEGLEFGKAVGYVSEEAQRAAEAAEALSTAFQGIIQSGDYVTVLENAHEPLVALSGANADLKVNIDGVHQGIFDQLTQMGAAPEVIAAYGVAVGIMSEDQAKAALTAAAVAIKIEELATLIAGGLPVETAMGDLDNFIAKIEDTGTAAGEGLAEGIKESTPAATDAITEAANEVINAANSTFEIHSPSQVFLGIGDNLGVSLVDGFSLAIGNARGTLEGIGQRVIDGVKAGIESAKAGLRAILSTVAGEIPEWLKKFLGIASPAAELVPVGVAVTEGVIEGIRARAASGSSEVVDIIDEMLRAARTFMSAGAGFGQMFTNQAITPIQRQIKALSEQADIMDMVFMQYASHLGLEWGSDNFWIELHRMSQSGTAEQQFLAAQMLSLYDQRQDALQQMTAAQAELVKQEEKLLRLEEARADLDFLRQQYELVKLIQENNLDTAILAGLTTGVNADAEAWMNAMIEATQAMIAAVEDELGIHSPSRWAVGVMHNIFDTMAETAERDAQALRNSMSRALEVGLAPATTTPVTTAAQTVDNSRRSVNYGGIHIHGETRYRSPLDVLQEQLV